MAYAVIQYTLVNRPNVTMLLDLIRIRKPQKKDK